MSSRNIQRQLNLKQNQFFGSQQSLQHVQQQDIINSIKFDPTGELLAIGDNAGRIILFKQQEDQFADKKSFQYYSQFQSHLPEFDSLKSLTLSQSIRQIEWMRPQGKYRKMVTSSCNSIKLWKIFQKTQNKVVMTSERDQTFHQFHNLSMPSLNKQTIFTANPQIQFPIKHNQAINKVGISFNQQYILSTDTQRGLMWNLQRFANPFIVQDISVKKNWQQGEKITCSKIHPSTDNMFLIGSTKGAVQLSDMRQSFQKRKSLTFLSQADKSLKDKNYFSSMTNKINSLDFLGQGKYVVSRDYQTVKIWDICRPTSPINQITINKSIKQKMYCLFQNQCIQDQFQITSFTQNLVVTGTYDNRFNLIDPVSNQNIQYKMDYKNNLQKTNINLQDSKFQQDFSFNNKVIACGVHKATKKIAFASLNSFFIYSPQNQSSIQPLL